MPSLRFHVEPRDVPPAIAARRLGLTEAAFTTALSDLLGRGFPPADPTTGHFDLDAIDQWRKQRHAELYQDPMAARSGAVAMRRLDALSRG